MSYFRGTQSALDTSLNDFVTNDGIDIAWENVTYTPTRGTAFIRPTLLFSPSENLTLKSDIQENRGIYQIDLFYPSEQGPGAIREMMDRLLDHFKSSLTLTQGSLVVNILNVSGVNPSLKEDIWYRGMLEINFVIHN